MALCCFEVSCPLSEFTFHTRLGVYPLLTQHLKSLAFTDPLVQRAFGKRGTQFQVVVACPLAVRHALAFPDGSSEMHAWVQSDSFLSTSCQVCLAPHHPLHLDSQIKGPSECQFLLGSAQAVESRRSLLAALAVNSHPELVPKPMSGFPDRIPSSEPLEHPWFHSSHLLSFPTASRKLHSMVIGSGRPEHSSSHPCWWPFPVVNTSNLYSYFCSQMHS